MIDIQDHLQSRGVLLADGATGTSLFEMGLQSGDAPELWNVNYPEYVAALHRTFIVAGSDIILTNSFGANRCRLALHKAEHRVHEVNEAAARIALQEATRGLSTVTSGGVRDILVGGSVGPTGELISPLGALQYDEAVQIFAEQAQALAAGGADVIWLETLSSREELQAAVQGAATSGLPIISTLSFDTNGCTMMGVTPTQLAQFCEQLQPAPVAYGINCGVGPADVVAGILCMSAFVESNTGSHGNTEAENARILVAKANCGVPQFVDGAIRYSGTPQIMADYANLAYAAGARIIGGCCGTTAEHIVAMREALDNKPPSTRPSLTEVEARLGAPSGGARKLCTESARGEGANGDGGSRVAEDTAKVDRLRARKSRRRARN